MKHFVSVTGSVFLAGEYGRKRDLLWYHKFKSPQFVNRYIYVYMYLRESMNNITKEF